MTRMEPGERKRQLTKAAARLAAKIGYQKVTREMLAKVTECSEALITYHFGTMTQLRRDIIRYAIGEQILPVIAQGLAVGDPHAKKAPEDLKRKALLAAAG